MTWEADFDALVASFDAAPFGQVQTFCSRVRSKVDALETRRLAAEAGSDSGRGSRLAGQGGKRSKAAARKAAGRAAAVRKNPALGDDLDSGRLSSEQLDTIAGAGESDPAALSDQGLIDAVAGASVDQGRRLAREWAQKRADKGKADSEYKRQRRQRTATTYLDRSTGLWNLKLTGDDASLTELWNQIQLRERQLWRADGGRDLAPSTHRRTREQRLFDAAMELICGTGATGETGSGGSRSVPSIVININGDRPDAPAERVNGSDSGPISDAAVAEIIERADLFVRIHDLTGETMWFGRLARRGSMAQYRALVARDKGCVMCGGSWLGCQVHHLDPWNAPIQGKTDIDRLALVCSGCHHILHAEHLSLERLADGTWKTRPALDCEIAPRRGGPGRERRESAGSRGRHPSAAVLGTGRASPGRAPSKSQTSRGGDQDNPVLFPSPARQTAGDGGDADGV